LDSLGLLLQILAIIGLYPLTAIDYGAGPALTAGGLGALFLSRRLNKKQVKSFLLIISLMTIMIDIIQINSLSFLLKVNSNFNCTKSSAKNGDKGK